MNEIVSVVILYYNQPLLVLDAIKSVLEQDYRYLELIIADDCSNLINKDSILNYIETNKGNNIVHYEIISQNINVGTVRNINNAIKRSCGKYIKIFAGDDVLACDNVISQQVNAINEMNVIAVTGKLLQCDNQLNPIHDASVELNNSKLPDILKMDPILREKYINRYNLFPYITQSLLFVRDFFNVYGFYDERFVLIEDTPMMWRIIDKDIKIGFVDEYVIKHRSNTGVSSSSLTLSSKKYVEDCILQLELMKDRDNNVFKRFDFSVRQKIFRMRYLLSLENSAKNKLFIKFRYLPYILSFVIFHPLRVIRMIGK